MSEPIQVTLPDSWDEVLASPRNHVWVDRFEDGVRFLILRGPSSVCAYIGVPKSHPLAGFEYDGVPLDCHGGLTFSCEGGETGPWPAGWWWYGWDYGHAGDRSTYDDLPGIKALGFGECDEQRWTPKMVDDESWITRYRFVKLARLAEKIAAKAVRARPTEQETSP